MKKLFLLLFFLSAQIASASTIVVNTDANPGFSFSDIQTNLGAGSTTGSPFDFTYIFNLTQDSSVTYNFDIFYTTTPTGKLRNYFSDFNLTVSSSAGNLSTITLEDLEDIYDGHISGTQSLLSDTYTIQISGVGIQKTTTPDVNPRFELSASVAPVPVPAAVWMLGTGLVAVLGMRRKMAA